MIDRGVYITGNNKVIINNIGETPTSFISLGIALTPATVKDEIYQQIFLHVLREKLMSNLREKNGLAYEVYPFATIPSAGKHLSFWQTSTAVEKTDNTIKQIQYELAHLQEGNERWFDVAKGRVYAELKGKFNSLGSMGNTVVEMVEYRRDRNYFDKVMEQLGEVDLVGFGDWVKGVDGKGFKIVVGTKR